MGPHEDATPELETAWESVSTLATLDVESVLCFHGGYLEAGTDQTEELIADR